MEVCVRARAFLVCVCVCVCMFGEGVCVFIRFVVRC